MSSTYTHKPASYSSSKAQPNGTGILFPDMQESVMIPSLSTNSYMEDPLAEFSSIFSMSPSTSDLDLSDFNFPLDSTKDTPLFDISEKSPESFTSPWTSHAPSPLSTHSSISEQSSPSKTETGNKKAPTPCCHKCKPKNKKGAFMCGWRNCLNPGPFTRKAVLMRHIDTQHISPREFVCSFEFCGKSFNRKDNLDEHLRRVHWRPEV